MDTLAVNVYMLLASYLHVLYNKALFITHTDSCKLYTNEPLPGRSTYISL